MAGWWCSGRCAAMTPRGSRRCGAAWMPGPGAGSPAWLICRPTVPVRWPSRGPAIRRGSSRLSRPARRGGWWAWRGMSAGQETRPGSWCSSTPPGGAPGWAPCCCAGWPRPPGTPGCGGWPGMCPGAMRRCWACSRSWDWSMTEQVTAATVHASFAVQETDAYLDAVLADQRAAARAAVGPFLRPRSIALVGASDKPASIGALLLANLLASGFTGPVYPVNPRHQVIQGVTAYPDLASCPQPPDLALVAVPAPLVAGVVDQAGALGVRAVCVISAGFAETGGAGPGPAGRPAPPRPRRRGAAHRAQLHGTAQRRARSPVQRDLQPRLPPAGPAGVRDPVRRARAGRAHPAHRPFARASAASCRSATPPT